MTAVVQPLPRNGWSSSQTDLDMSADDVSRMFVPRKSAQRTPSSSSLASTTSSTSTSSTSTVSPTTTQPNGVINGETSWAARKKPARGIWPASSKAEPVAGLSTARTQSVPANASGPSATSAISALHGPPQPQSQIPLQQNGPLTRGGGQSESQAQAQLHLQPLNGTFERKAIKIPFAPDLVRIGRQTNNKTIPTPENGYFDSKVLSRQHAEVWADRQGHIWIRDVKSSNGTFVNGKRLSQENRDSDPHLLKEADVLELGIDIVSEDQKTVVHHKVAARVDHAGLWTPGPDISDYTDSDLALSNGVTSQHLNQNGRGRPPSQGLHAGNGRFGSAGVAASNAPAPPPYQSKWLQPVTMEQIVKRLNTELKSARVQSSSVRQSSSYVKAINAGEQPHPPPGLVQPSSTKSMDNNNPRQISLPSQSSPTQPRAEAPSEEEDTGKLTDVSFQQPLLRRSDTERPRTSGPSLESSMSPAKSEQSSQILNLVEALSIAQREIVSQSEKLNEMEAALAREREERKIAEERAVKLQSGTSYSLQDAATGSKHIEESSAGAGGQKPIAEIDAAALQQRVDLMRAEMDSMKLQMERYRQRAESAEEESQRDRKGLAEMVQSIKKREEAAKKRAEKRRKSKRAEGTSAEESLSQEKEDRDIEQLDEELGKELARAESRLLAVSYSADGLEYAPNGNASNHQMSISDLQQLGKAAMVAAMGSENQDTDSAHNKDISQLGAEQGTFSNQRSRRQQQLSQTAPYASMLGVILLGVGVMAYLNGWQKVAER